MFTNSLIELKKQIGIIWSKIQEASFANNEKLIILKKITFLLKREILKVNSVEEEQDGADIDGIGNLMDLPKLMFIDEDCGNLKGVVDGG